MWLTTPILWLSISALPAHARKTQEREVIMDLLERPEPDPLGRTGLERMFTTFGGVRPKGETEEVVTEGGKLTLTCKVFERNMMVELAYDTANYPEHLPEEMRCTVGNIDLTVRFVGIPPLYGDISERRVSSEAPAQWRRRGTATRSVGDRTFALPSDTVFADTSVVARSMDGPFWHGVTCRVTSEPEGQLLTVNVDDPTLPDGTGHCLLPTESGDAVDIPVELVTVRR